VVQEDVGYYMKIDDYIQKFLEKFGETKAGEWRFHFHSQNLNEDRRGNPKGFPFEGRCWLRLNGVKQATISLEWALRTSAAHASVNVDPGESKILLSWALPPVSLYLGFESWLLLKSILKNIKGYEDRELGISFHDWTLWWNVWHPSTSWHSKTPKWRSGNFSFKDFTLGKRTYREEPYEIRDVVIPMPEGSYKAKATLYNAIRGFERIPFERDCLTVKIDMERPIPFSGKGENSWDCGEDGIYGHTGQARTIEEGIAHVVQSVLETRKKRGDPAKWPVYPPPPPVRAEASEEKASESR
jgi:hypothetical protein